MAAPGVAGLPDLAERLPRGDALALAHERPRVEVHVDVFESGVARADDEVVAGRAVVRDLAHPAGSGGHHGRAAGGEHVLPVVPAPAAEPVRGGPAEIVLALEREDVGEQLESGAHLVALEP